MVPVEIWVFSQFISGETGQRKSKEVLMACDRSRDSAYPLVHSPRLFCLMALATLTVCCRTAPAQTLIYKPGPPVAITQATLRGIAGGNPIVSFSDSTTNGGKPTITLNLGTTSAGGAMLAATT